MTGRYCYEYPRPAVTTDVATFRRSEDRWEILLIRRRKEPFDGQYALPGGFVDELEPLADAARRELREETGVVADQCEQMRAYGDPGRDPRGHTVSIAHCAIVPAGTAASAGDDAAEAAWFPLDSLPELAFDHARIVSDAIAWLASRTHEND